MRAVMAAFSIYPLCIIGAVALLIACESKANKILISSAGAIVCFVLIVNIIKINECEVNQKKQNAIDENWAKSIIYEISQYEIQSGNKVSKIAFSNDKSPSDVPSPSYLGSSAMHCDWATIYLINLNIEDHEYLVEIDMPDDIAGYYSDKDWDVFVVDDQLIFDKDCCYVCTY